MEVVLAIAFVAVLVFTLALARAAGSASRAMERRQAEIDALERLWEAS